jgi:hypothetical protein
LVINGWDITLEFDGLAHHTAGDVTDANFLGVVGETSGARKHDNVDDRKKKQVMIDIISRFLLGIDQRSNGTLMTLDEMSLGRQNNFLSGCYLKGDPGMR